MIRREFFKKAGVRSDTFVYLRTLAVIAFASMFALGAPPNADADFVPNPQCTIGNTWDPDVARPDPNALAQLAPGGILRVGIYTGNRAMGSQNPTTSRLSGPGIDVACRMAALLQLPLEFVPIPSLPDFLPAFRAGAFEIGFATEVTLGAADQAFAHAYVGVENTYLVPVDSRFRTVNDLDQPGVRIAVPIGSSPDLYLTVHLRFATLIRPPATTSGNQSAPSFALLKDGAVDAVGTGRAGELMFISTMWQGQGRVLPDNIFVANLAPFMHQGNADAVCWLSDYVEGAKASGLLAQANARLNGTIPGLIVPAPLPGCPTSTAALSPLPNGAGWNKGDVTVALAATDDEISSGIKNIQFSLSGAQGGSATVAGNAALVPIAAEGITTLTYFATDVAGNVEPPKTQIIRIDKTLPIISATVTPPPNAAGWNNTNVTVTFEATDSLSGIAALSGPITLATEGSGQQISGTATDRAGNSTSVRVKLDIDKTPPIISGLPDPGCTIWPPNHALVQVATVMAADDLSGVAPGSPTVTGTSSELPLQLGNGQTLTDIVVTGTTVKLRAERSGTGTGRAYTLTATASDVAGNSTTTTAVCTVPHDQR